MESLYITEERDAVEVPFDMESLDRLVHASFVAGNSGRLGIAEEEVLKRAREEAKVELEQVSSGRYYHSLESFIPIGAPQFANCGHNGYTMGGERLAYDFDSNEFLGDFVMGKAFVGSSSHVYVPLVEVEKRNWDRRVEFVGELPTLMIYDNGALVEAKYNIRKARFEKIKGRRRVDPQALQMVEGVRGFSEYIKDPSQMEVLSHFRRYELPPTRNVGGTVMDDLLAPFRATWVGMKALGRVLAYRNFMMGSFEDQVGAHFSRYGKFLRTVSAGDKFNGWVSEEQIGSFSHATYDEIGEAVHEIGRVRIERGA